MGMIEQKFGCDDFYIVVIIVILACAGKIIGIFSGVLRL